MVWFPVGSDRRLEKRYLRCLLLGDNRQMQKIGSRAVLPLTRHQCNIHYEHSHVAPGASKRSWVPQNTHDIPERSAKTGYEWILNTLFRYDWLWATNATSTNFDRKLRNRLSAFLHKLALDLRKNCWWNHMCWSIKRQANRTYSRHIQA